MNSLISIIIPIYNAERYLAECLNSVLAQSYSNFELLLIDDGSKDASADISKRYVKSDKRIRYIYQDNAGVSAARNRGMDEAKGVYISFVDADDILMHECLEQMHSSITENGVDMTCCGIDEIQNDGQKAKSIVVNEYLEQNTVEAVRTFFMMSYGIITVWGKLYKKSLIDEFDLRFDTRFRYAEDKLFIYLYLQNCKAINYLPACLYQYRIDNVGSVMNFDKVGGQFNKKRLEDGVVVLSEILQHAKDNFTTDVYKLACARFFDTYKMHLRLYIIYDCKDKEVLHSIKLKMKSLLWNSLSCRDIGVKRKIINIMLTFLPIWIMKKGARHVVRE